VKNLSWRLVLVCSVACGSTHDGGPAAWDAAADDATIDAPADAVSDARVDADAASDAKGDAEVARDAGVDVDSGCTPGAPCDDGNACTVGDMCGDAGVCVGGAARDCDDGNVCTVDSCNASSGCVNVARSTCGEANCALGACAGADTDGDGFSDAVEDADYIDLNCNGVHDAADFDFPHRALHVFSAVSQAGSGDGVLMPTVTDPTASIASSSVVVTVATSGSVGVATFTYSLNGGPSSAAAEARPFVDIAGNVRLLFYASAMGAVGFVKGDTYSFTTAMGPSTKVADKQRPNVYVQYDYMDFAAPGAACTTDADCDANGVELNDVCHANACNHDHFPDDPLFRKVVDAYAAHGLTLYIDPVHHAIPHATVVTFSRPGDGTQGAKAACAGADVVAGDITTGGAVNFHDIKNRNGYGGPFDPKRKQVFRYTVFAHDNTCLSDAQGPGWCGACPPGRSTPPGLPFAGASGTAELPGNDFIVSLGDALNNAGGSTPNDPFIESGVFMHELGHTLGLHHFGDTGSPVLAPNYLSVMNYDYALKGILHASAPGSSVSVEALRELNYSEHTLGTLNEASLVEANGVSPVSSGYTGLVFFYNGMASYSVAPESGPIDWNGNGVIDSSPVVADLNLVNGATETMRGYRDWDHTAVDGGACTVNTDCRINVIRQLINSSGLDGGALVDPHEPCVAGACQSLGYAFQCFPWGMAD
jgi:hypothetical protein